LTAEPRDLISTTATRSPARAQRMAQRRAQVTLSRIVKRTGPRFERRLSEGLGFDFDTGKPLTDSPLAAFAACSHCKRPFVQEWAIREAGAMLRAALGKPENALQIVQMIGAPLEEAQRAIGMYRSVESVDQATLTEWSRAHLVEQGWTCLPPGQDASTNGGGTDAHGSPQP
jgi:hypothetical protein